jgi:hypothetical protein
MIDNKHGPRPQNPVLQRLERQAKQSPAYHASAGLEKKLATRTGGYRTAGSGNKLTKGDVQKHGIFRIEHKATGAGSFRVTGEMLEKIELAGRGCDEIPIMVIDFLDDRGRSHSKEIAVLPFKDLLDLLDRLNNDPSTQNVSAPVKPKPKRRKL